MKRLRDTKTVPGSIEAILVEVIKSSAPVEISFANQQRVLERVLERQRRRGMGLAFLRPAVVVGVLLVAGVTAAAALGHGWIAQGLRRWGDPPPVVAPATAPAAIYRPRAAAIAERAAPAPTEVEPAPAPAPSSTAVALHPAPRPALRARAAKTEDPSLVVDAIRTLRTDRDARRAATLLAEYLRIYPRGALAEEALALSIEAADARRSPRAAIFAEQYLRQYPSGRFKRAAEQALAQRQP